MSEKALVSEFSFPSEHEPPFLVEPSQGDPRALILYLHWFDEAPSANRTQYLEEAKQMAVHGFAGLLPQLAFPWKVPPAGLPADAESINAESRQLVALVEGAKQHLHLDEVAVVGHDFGAMHGSLVSHRIQSKCNVFVAPTPRWSDWFLRFWPINDDRYDYMRALAPLDPIAMVADIEAPTLYQFARNDFYIAAMTGLELFDAAREPKAMKPYEADHSMESDLARTDRIDFLLQTLGH